MKTDEEGNENIVVPINVLRQRRTLNLREILPIRSTEALL